MNRSVDEAIAGFLLGVRRRWLVRRGLQALLIAVAAQYAILAATRIVNRSFQLRLPELTTGIYLALVLVAGAALRARPARMAREADRALGLKDRLASFLDLGARRDVDGRYREAQAAETAAALDGVDPAAAVAVPRWLWAAPPLFLWMVYASYFAFFLPQPLQWVRQFRVAVTGGAGGGAPEGSAPGKSAPSSGDPGSGEAGRPAPKPSPEPAGQKVVSSPPPPEKPHPDLTRGAADLAETAGQAGGGASGPGSGAGGGANFPQPARLFSVPVGSGLTPVGATAAGTATKGGGPAGTAPRGRVAFNLVPGRGAGSGLLGPGSGQGTGKEGALRIEVDFATLAPEVRENVRRYFDELSSLFTGGSLGTR